MKKKATRKKATKRKAAKKKTAAMKRPKKKATRKRAGARKVAGKKKATRKKATRKTAKKKVARKSVRKKAAPKTTSKTSKRAGGVRKRSSGKTKLTAAEKRKLRETLLALRDRLSGQMQSLKTEALTRNDSVVSLEDGTDAFDRQFGLSLASSEGDALFEIDEALHRLEEGTYGLCDECGDMIEKPRLKALPFVKTCISCQSEIEKRNPGYGSVYPRGY